MVLLEKSMSNRCKENCFQPEEYPLQQASLSLPRVPRHAFVLSSCGLARQHHVGSEWSAERLQLFNISLPHMSSHTGACSPHFLRVLPGP